MYQDRQPFERALALAALSGLKVALGPAFLAAARNRPEARNWVLGAMGEMALDKIGVFPPRYRPSLLIPHAIAGAYVAREALKEEGQDEPMAVAAGAAVAAGVAIAAPIVRMFGSKVLGMPDILLALVEDYLALRLGSQVTGVPMERVAEEAKGAFEQVKGQAMPVFEQLRDQAMPVVEQVAGRVGLPLGSGHGNGISQGAGI